MPDREAHYWCRCGAGPKTLDVSETLQAVVCEACGARLIYAGLGPSGFERARACTRIRRELRPDPPDSALRLVDGAPAPGPLWGNSEK